MKSLRVSSQGSLKLRYPFYLVWGPPRMVLKPNCSSVHNLGSLKAARSLQPSMHIKVNYRHRYFEPENLEELIIRWRKENFNATPPVFFFVIIPVLLSNGIAVILLRGNLWRCKGSGPGTPYVISQKEGSAFSWPCQTNLYLHRVLSLSISFLGRVDAINWL